MWSVMADFLSRMVFLVLSVVNSGSFPKPLSAKEERAALAAMAAGDTDARRRLIEHNLRLVAHIIKKHYANARDQEDLVSIGTVGLIKAVDSFDGRKGSRLATYAARCIENAILTSMTQTLLPSTATGIPCYTSFIRFGLFPKMPLSVRRLLFTERNEIYLDMTSPS